MSTLNSAAEAAIERPSPTASPSPSRAAVSVVSKFVKRYYALVDPAKNADFAQFYQEDSLVTRADVGAEAATGRGVEQGVSVASARPYQSRDSVTLTAVDFHEGADRAIVLLVQGALVNLDGASRRFVQSFYLAVVPGSEEETVPRYYVRHDLLRFLEAAAPAAVASAQAPAVAAKEPATSVAPSPAAPAPALPPSASPAPAPAASPAPEPKPAVETKVEVAPAAAAVATAPAAQTSGGDADNKSKRPPRQPRGPKREGSPNGVANGNGKSSPKTDRKEDPAKPPAPATWAQRVAKSADSVASTAAATNAASTPSVPVPAAANVASPAPAAVKPADAGPAPKSGPKGDIRSGNAGGRRESPKTSDKAGGRRPDQRGGEGRVDDGRTLVLKNVPFEMTDPEAVRALLTKAAPDGLGLGPEIASIDIKKGNAFLAFSTAEQAQRVLRLSQTAKLVLGGREIRVEARNPQRPRQGAPQ